MPRTISPERKAARMKDERFYIGQPCGKGHATGERYTSTGACRECVAGQTRPDRKQKPASDEFDALLGE